MVSITPMTFVDSVSGGQRIRLGGAWRQEEAAADITTRGVFLETITGAIGRPAIYGGVMISTRRSRNSNATNCPGDREHHRRTVRRLTYGDWLARSTTATSMRLDLRLDQAPDVWLTAAGISASRPRRRQPARQSAGRDNHLELGRTRIDRSVDQRRPQGLWNDAGRRAGAIGTARDPVSRARSASRARRLWSAPPASGPQRHRGAAAGSGPGHPSNGFGSRIRGAAPWNWLAASAPVSSGSGAGTRYARPRLMVLDNEFREMEVDADLKLRGQFESRVVLGP